MRTIFDDDEPISFINSAVQVVIKALGYVYTTSGPNDFRFKVQITPGQWFRAQVLTVPESSVVRFFVFVTDSEYPDHRAPFVSQLAQLTTDMGVFGAFAQGQNGSVAYRDAEQVIESAASVQVANLLNRCTFPVRFWTRAFNCWKMEKATAHAAFRLACMLEDIDDEAPSILENRIGHLLMVEDGNGAVESPPSSPPNLSLI